MPGGILGKRYSIRLLTGRGVRENKAEGMRYLKMATDQGLPAAQCAYQLAIAMDGNQGGSEQTTSKVGNEPSGEKVPLGLSDVGQLLGKYGGMSTKDQGRDKASSFDITALISMTAQAKHAQRQRSPEETAGHWQKLAARMDPHGMAMYGRCLADGYGIAKNLQRAVRYYRDSAELDDPTGQMCYAQCCATGTSVAKNLREAEKYFKMAVNQGSSEAQAQYGVFLFTNFHNDTARVEEARHYLKIAAERGESVAQGIYGCILCNSCNSKDRQEGIRYWKCAADQGNRNAQMAYGCTLLSGYYGQKKVVAEGLKYIRLAADREGVDPRAHYLCAQLLCDRDNDVCLAEAARFYKLAADKGHAEAQLQYGVLLEEGFGATTGITEATRYYKLAVDNGVAEAQVRYGKVLFSSAGTVPEAAQYFKRAAEQGYACGQTAYGACLMAGRGEACCGSRRTGRSMEIGDVFRARLRRC